MIKSIDKFLSDDELEYLLSKCEVFVKNNDTIPDGRYSFYNSMHLYTDPNLDDLKNRITKYVGNTYEIQHNGIFINKITPETNRNDSYHIDSSDLSCVIFLNDDYDGGDFEYCEPSTKSQKITPTTHKTIFLNKDVLHRVLPIENGVRYTLIIWFRIAKKSLL